MKKISLLLTTLLLFVFPSYAFSGLGLGVRTGVVKNYENPKLGNFIKDMDMLGAHMKIGALSIIDLEISGEYCWKTRDGAYVITTYFYPLDENPSSGDTVTLKFKVEDYSVNATAKCVLPTGTVRPYVGVGGGMHFLRYKYTIPDEDAKAQTETKPSYHFCVGVLLNVPVIPLDIFAEGRYSSIQTEKKATTFFTWMLGATLNLP